MKKFTFIFFGVLLFGASCSVPWPRTPTVESQPEASNPQSAATVPVAADCVPFVPSALTSSSQTNPTPTQSLYPASIEQEFSSNYPTASVVVEHYLSALIKKDLTSAQKLLTVGSLSRVDTIESQDYINNLLTGFDIQQVGLAPSLEHSPRGTYQVTVLQHFTDEKRGISGRRTNDYFVTPLPPGDFFITDVQHGETTTIGFLPSVRRVPSRLAYIEGPVVHVLESNGLDCTIKTYDSSQEVFITGWSPDGATLLLEHFNEERDGYGGLFGPAQTGLTILATQPPYTSTELVKAGATSQQDFYWSPDSKYFSYVVNGGAGISIVDAQARSEVIHLESKPDNYGARPLTWLDNDRFAFVLDAKGYLGTLAQPKGQVLANDVNNSVCQFESPPSLLPLDWSNDRNAFAYLSPATLVVASVPPKRPFSAGSLTSDEGYCGSEVNISPLGWFDKDKYLFIEYSVSPLKAAIGDSEGPVVSTLQSIKSPEGTINKYPLINKDMRVYDIGDVEISSGSHYAIGLGSNLPTKTGLRPWINNVYDLISDQKICQLDGNGVVVRDRNGDWASDDYILLSYGSQTFNVINLHTCKSIGVVTLVKDGLKGVEVFDSSSMPTISELVQLFR